MARIVRRSWQVRTTAAAAVASAFLASCGGAQVANDATTSSSLPPLTNSFQFDGLRFSAPRGFMLAKVDPNASTAGTVLDEPSMQGRIDCPDGRSWEITAVDFTSASAMQGVSGALHKIELGHGLNAWGDDPIVSSIASGHDCKYVTQHIILPNLGVGMAISGDGVTANSALALSREIVASATPGSSSESG